ncbi:MAG: hypothetical protein Q9195_004485 [Heterodermia aff. obscurata]
MSPRNATISSENQGPIINLATWITLCAAILAAGVKVYTKKIMRSVVDLNDLFIVLAVVGCLGKFVVETKLTWRQAAAIAQCVAANAQVHYGLGQHMDKLAPGAIDNVYIVSTGVRSLSCGLKWDLLGKWKEYLTITHPPLTGTSFRDGALVRLLYSGEILQATKEDDIASLGCALLGVAMASRNDRYTFLSLPNPPEFKKMLAFWISNAAIDVLTQIIVSFLPVYLLFDLHLSSSRKAFSMLSFTPNMITLPLIILRILYIRHLTTSLPTPDADISRLLFHPCLLTSLHTNIAILAACIPFTKPIIDSMATGAISNDIANPLGWAAQSYKISGSGFSTPGTAKVNHASMGFGVRARGDNVYSGQWKGKGHGVVSSIVANGGGKNNKDVDVELEEGTNREGSTERMVIRQTRDINIVSFEGREDWVGGLVDTKSNTMESSIRSWWTLHPRQHLSHYAAKQLLDEAPRFLESQLRQIPLVTPTTPEEFCQCSVYGQVAPLQSSSHCATKQLINEARRSLKSQLQLGNFCQLFPPTPDEND